MLISSSIGAIDINSIFFSLVELMERGRKSGVEIAQRKMAIQGVSRIWGENSGPCVGALGPRDGYFFRSSNRHAMGERWRSAIIYAPHLHVRDFCWGRTRTRRMEKRADAVCHRNFSKCRTVSNVTSN